MNSKQKQAHVILFLMLLVCIPRMASAGNLTIDGAPYYNLGPWLDIYEDKTRNLTIDQIIRRETSEKFLPSPAKVPSYGLTRSAYWLRFNLENRLPSAEYLLEFPWPLFDRLEVYCIDPSGRPLSIARTGDLLPFSERPIFHRNFVVRLPLLADGGVTTFYAHAQSNDAMLLATHLWEKSAFAKKDHNNAYLLGLFFGILGVMILYNLLLSITLHDKLYLYFVFMLSGYFLFELTYTGIGYAHFWPHSPWIQQRALPLFMALCFVGFVMFTRRYLKLRALTPKPDIFLRSLTGLVLLVIPFIPFTDTLNSVRLLNVLILAVLATMCAIIPLLFRKSNRPAMLYLIIWMPFLVLVSLLVLRNMALIPFPEAFFMENSAKIGAILQVTLVSIAIGTKMRQERDIAQQAAIRNLQKAEKQLENFILTLADTIETKDAYTGGHVLRVANYSRDVSRHLGFPEETIKQIYLGAIVHDIGKIGIPDLMLNKQSMLTHPEFEVIKKHTIMGHRLLTKIEDIQIPSQIALSHQERWDGKGYPHGLSGEKIPIEARIVTVADYWDSIITDRPYRKAMTVETALEIMLKEREKAFDPAILDIFISNRIYLNYLSPEKHSPAPVVGPVCAN